MKVTDCAGLQAEISRILKDYNQEVKEGLSDAITEMGKECLKEVKEAAPVKTGDYQKALMITKETKGYKDIPTEKIHAGGKEYRLTHLLENGHAIAGGTGRVEGHPHFKKGQEYLDSNYESVLKKHLEKG